MILEVMNAIYAIAYIEAWQIQDFNPRWSPEFSRVVHTFLKDY